MNRWEFNKEISDIFDTHVVQSVPRYNDIQKLVCDFSDFFIRENSVVYDIGCSTGETLNRLYLKHNEKNLKLIGIDNSSEMIEKAKSKDVFKSITFLNEDINAYEFKEKSSYITSILSLQFVNPAERELLLKKIYDALNFNGAFIMVEKIYSNNSQTQDIFNQIYYDFKLNHNLSHEHILNKSQQLRGVLQSSSDETNLKLLKGAGFNKVDVFFKHLNFIGYIAIKD